MWPESLCRTGQKVKWVFWHVGKVKSSFQQHGIHKIKPSKFVPNISRFQKKILFINSRIADGVSDMTLFHLG